MRVLLFEDGSCSSERNKLFELIQKNCSNGQDIYYELSNTMSEGLALHEIICDKEGQPYDYRFISVNAAFEIITGIRCEEAVGHTVREILPNIEASWMKLIGEVALGDKVISYESYFNDLDKFLKVNAFGIENGKFITLFSDITEIKKSEILSKKYQLLLDNAKDIILFYDESGNIIEANAAAIKVYGYSYEQLISMNISDISLSGPDCISSENIDEACGNGLILEAVHRKKNGNTFRVEMSSKGTRFNGELVFINIIRDVTERKRMEEKLQRLAYYDPVTDLPNKKAFNEYIMQELKNIDYNSEMLAILFVDLDRYKKVNDTMGHLMGDKLLKAAAERFTELTTGSIFVSRVGGDEFIFVQSHIGSSEEAAELAYKILKEVKKPFYLDGNEVNITASIGISIYPKHGKDALTLMKNADISMYRVKSKGRNNYEFYTDDINKETYEELIIENNLHKALENNELVLYYQPKFNVSTGRVVGMEALIRWQSKVLGIVPPGKFISLAEENGLIVPIGEWVLRTACKQNKEWQDTGYYPMSVAVNLSVRQFEQRDLVETIERILKETGLDPKYLELEITETMAVKNMDSIIKTLRKLKEMGIKIALDDFGTGYSSLKYLRNIPVDTLKIDQSFVNDITSNPNYVAIIDAIIDIAGKLQLSLIAEGVETIEQKDFLSSKKCYEMQGYLFGKPMSKADFEAMLKQRK